MTTTEKTHDTETVPAYLEPYYFKSLYHRNKKGLIDYFEKEGQAALDEYRDAYIRLFEDARKTQTFLLAGLGVSFGYWFTLNSQPASKTTLLFCIGAMGVWLLVCTVILMSKCLLTKKVPSCRMLPQNMYTAEAIEVGVDYKAAKIIHLEDLHQKTLLHRKTNSRFAAGLDCVRIMIACTPAIMLLGYLSGLALSFV